METEPGTYFLCLLGRGESGETVGIRECIPLVLHWQIGTDTSRISVDCLERHGPCRDIQRNQVAQNVFPLVTISPNIFMVFVVGIGVDPMVAFAALLGLWLPANQGLRI